MNSFLVVAASLVILGGILHSILGERLILSNCEPKQLPETLGSSVFTLQVLRLFWHLVSVAWWGFATLLAYLATIPVDAASQPLVRIIALTFLVSALAAFILSRGKHFSWGVLLIVAVLAWLGGG